MLSDTVDLEPHLFGEHDLVENLAETLSIPIVSPVFGLG